MGVKFTVEMTPAKMAPTGYKFSLMDRSTALKILDFCMTCRHSLLQHVPDELEPVFYLKVPTV